MDSAGTPGSPAAATGVAPQAGTTAPGPTSASPTSRPADTGPAWPQGAGSATPQGPALRKRAGTAWSGVRGGRGFVKTNASGKESKQTFPLNSISFSFLKFDRALRRRMLCRLLALPRLGRPLVPAPLQAVPRKMSRGRRNVLRSDREDGLLPQGDLPIHHGTADNDNSNNNYHNH